MAPNNVQQASPIAEFLTPEAMLTPGVAGALTMMISNALAVSFNAPRAGTGLLLSFVFGLLVLVSTKDLLTKSVFYVLNSLVIFCVAIGANSLGTASSRTTSSGVITSAFAQTSSPDVAGQDTTEVLKRCAAIGAEISKARAAGATDAEILKLVEPCQTISREILSRGVLGGPNSELSKIDKEVAKPFFAPWRLRIPRL